MRVRLTVEAEEELSGAAAFCAREATVSLGKAFIDEVSRACKRLQ